MDDTFCVNDEGSVNLIILSRSQTYYTRSPNPLALSERLRQEKGGFRVRVPQNWEATDLSGFPDLRKVAWI
jgi:hypothetical protein